jgi:hypothetical protein
MIFNAIASIIVKWLRLHLLLGCTIFSLTQRWFGIVYIAGLLWLHHIQYFSNAITMSTNACYLL